MVSREGNSNDFWLFNSALCCQETPVRKTNHRYLIPSLIFGCSLHFLQQWTGGRQRVGWWLQQEQAELSQLPHPSQPSHCGACQTATHLLIGAPGNTFFPHFSFSFPVKNYKTSTKAFPELNTEPLGNCRPWKFCFSLHNHTIRTILHNLFIIHLATYQNNIAFLFHFKPAHFVLLGQHTFERLSRGFIYALFVWLKEKLRRNFWAPSIAVIRQNRTSEATKFIRHINHIPSSEPEKSQRHKDLTGGCSSLLHTDTCLSVDPWTHDFSGCPSGPLRWLCGHTDFCWKQVKDLLMVWDMRRASNAV